MPLGLGLAISHSPVLYRPRDQWEGIYKKLIGNVNQPTKALQESPEMLDSYNQRLIGGFAVLKEKLKSYKPDAVIMLTSDKGRMFGETQIPQISVFHGEAVWGSSRYVHIGEEESEEARVVIPNNPALALWLADEVTELGFDLNVNRTFKPLGYPAGGVGHALTDPYTKLLADLKVPVIPVFINAHVNPAISGHRMPALGRAIAQVMSERTERVAIMASGGLSGDPQGYLAGWVDELMDYWVLSHLRRGKSQKLETMWDVDSTTLRGASREIRNWIAAGAAMESVGAKATIVDYMRFHRATVGTAFAYWEP